MKYIEGQARDQITLMPDSVEEYVEEYVGEDNPVRVIDAFVDGLDIAVLGFERSKPTETGRPSYDPRDLIKLYVYGYFNKIRSSRMLQRECGRNVEVMYLLNRLTPDFRTISDFRKDNAKALKGVFTAFVKLCMKLKLYQKELLAVDGSKFRVVNSKDNCYTADVLAKKIATIDGHIADYLKRLDDSDKEELTIPEATAEEIKSAINDLRTRKEKYEGYAKRLEESGDKQLLTTDGEAHRMHSKDGFHCSYNILTAVDDGSHTEAYQKGEDLHRLTASLMLNKPIDTIESQERQAAKAVNFGLIYAMGAAGLKQYSQQSYGVEMKLEEAEEFRNRFFQAYTGIARWHNHLKKNQPTENRSLAGRKFTFSNNAGLAVLSNTPVQGTAADIAKKALGSLVPCLKNTNARIIGVIHDEIILEAENDYVNEASEILKSTMEEAGNSILKRVPCLADVNISENWAK